VDLHQGVIRVKVKAGDMSGIRGGKVIYTPGDGQWSSLDLTYDPDAMRWMTEIPAIQAVLYYVQVVDTAGNVTTANNKGRYYSVGESIGQVYLPVLLAAP